MSGTSFPGGRVRIVAVFAVPVVLLAGCGSDDAEGPADSVVAAASSTAASVTPSPVADSPAPEEEISVTMFRMPSGNIGCAIDNAGVRCDVRLPSWSPPPRPKSCEGDWGQALNLSPKRAELICAGDSAFEPEAPVLAYGTEKRVNGYVCTSGQEGVRCEHSPSGHGFMLSRSAYKLF